MPSREDVELREPTDADWSEILRVANESVAHVPAAGVQDEWLANRRAIDPAERTRIHVVAENRAAARIVGYGALEARVNDPRHLRLFVVCASADLPGAGAMLFDHLWQALEALQPTHVWFIEYAEDSPLREFARARGFSEESHFRLPTGQEAVTLLLKLTRHAAPQQAAAPVGRASMAGVVVSVSRSPRHTFSKEVLECIRLLAGLGVEDDAHMGRTVKHRSRVARDPDQPNLRQVHLIHAELHDELRAAGFDLAPGQLGENLTTRGIELLRLPRFSRLRIGRTVLLEITGLRNPCKQLDQFQNGLMSAVLDRDETGKLVRKAGVMAIVVAGGDVRPGDAVQVELPPEPHQLLEVV